MKETNKPPLTAVEFEQAAQLTINKISEFLTGIDERKLVTRKSPKTLQGILKNKKLPEDGMDAEALIDETFDKLIDNSLYNGHPGFMGYITSSALPISAIADLIASTINQNLGGWRLSPMASEIERLSISWISDFIRYDKNCGGILVSGGNMANFLGFLVAKSVKGGADLPQRGLKRKDKQMVCYASEETHTWLQKASDLFGIGKKAVRWIKTDKDQGMDIKDLEEKIKKDIKKGMQPFMVVGTAGSVSVGAVDPLKAIKKICDKYDIWFHVDGAYGAPAAALPTVSEELHSLSLADSVAVDPHKWLYSSLEVGCTLVKDPDHLRQTFSHHPAYYEFGTQNDEIDYHEYGMQNSRGFRALKVWMGFKLLGKKGFVDLIEKDIRLAELLYKKCDSYSNIEALTIRLSICTFRYIPDRLKAKAGEFQNEINDINKEILQKVCSSGKVFVSNAYIDGNYCLRACLVNFRTREEDLDVLLQLVDKFGKELS